MSRGSVENHLYVVAPRARERDEYAPEENQRDPLEALVASLEYSHAQTAALDVAAREGIGQMTTAELVAERTRLSEVIHDAARRGGGELVRVRAQLAEAERSVADARQRMEATGTSAAAAVYAQACERAAQLAGRERHFVARDESGVSILRPQNLTRFRAISEELDRRRAVRARAAVVERPEYLSRELGSYPQHRGERREWNRAARRIESYRQDFGIADQESALGGEPAEMRQRAALRAVERDVERARHRLARAPERVAPSSRELR
jgi:hypothetical protein